MDRDLEDARTDARLYGLIHRGNPGDLAFYAAACSGAGTILELGCGTGRVLLALAAAGHEVTGLDVDRARLDEAERVARERDLPVRLVRADMSRFDLGARFDRVIAPFHVLFALLEDDRLASCLACVRDHLVAGGRFACDGYRLDPDVRRDARSDPGPPEPLVTIQDGEETVRVFEQDRWLADEGRIDVTYTFHVHRPGTGVRVRRQIVRHRIRAPGEIVDALAAAGLDVVDGPVLRGKRDGGRWFTIVASRPAQ